MAPSRWHSARGREGKWICANWASGRLPEDDRQTERESSGTGATPVATRRQAEHTRERVDPTNGASDWPEDERRKEGESSGSRATGVTPVAVLRLAGTPWAKGKSRELRRVGEGRGRAPGSYEEQTHPNVWQGGCPHLLEEQPPRDCGCPPTDYERDGVLYVVAFGLRLKRTRESVAVTPTYATWGGERCGRRRHARREDKDGSCTRRAAAAKQSCTRRAATAKPGRGRRGRRTAGEPAHRRGAHGHRRQWSRPQWGVRVWTLA